MMDPAKLRARAKRAQGVRDLSAPLLDDAYDFLLPYRGGGRFRRQSQGASRVDRIFDGTGPQAAMRFAGRIQSAVTPPFNEIFQLEKGPVADKVLSQHSIDPSAFTRELQATSAVVHASIHNGSFHVASHEMYQDLFIGTGALLMEDGEDDDEITRDVAVPCYEIALELDGWGRVSGIHWQRDWKAGAIEEAWPKGEFSAELRKTMRDKSDTDVPILQSTVYDRKTRSWQLSVLEMSEKAKSPPIHTKSYRTCPWLTPRFWVIPGEVLGRGPGLIALPFVKTLNKARELHLHAAAFALLGAWSYRPDGIFNPNTVNWAPGALITVGANGGPMGPTLQKLDIPNRFDISQIVIADEREQARHAMLDEDLPPDDGAVRSATEIAARIRRVAENLGGAYSRLALEVVVPLVRRRIDILQGRGMIKFNMAIDQLLVALKVTSPIAQTQRANKVQPQADWLTMVQSLMGPQAIPLVSVIEELLPDMGRSLGVDEKFIRDPKGMAMLKAWVDQAAQEKADAMIAAMESQGQMNGATAQ